MSFSYEKIKSHIIHIAYICNIAGLDDPCVWYGYLFMKKCIICEEEKDDIHFIQKNKRFCVTNEYCLHCATKHRIKFKIPFCPEKAEVKKTHYRNKPKMGYDVHHWSYKIINSESIIYLNRKDHEGLHRLLIYDITEKAYRPKANIDILLDTREKHIDFIKTYLNIII